LRPNANGHQQRAQHGEDVEHDVRPSTGVRSMTSRGTKYWDSGAIPLIAPEILGNIIAEVADLGIKDVNSAALSMFDMPLDDLIGRPLSGCFVQRDAGDLLSDLTTNAIADAAEPLRAMLRSSDEIVSLTPVLFRAAGDRMVLCRIAHQDATNIRDDDLSANLRGMYHGTPDAIVFASDDGRILSANDGFLSLVDTAHDISVRGKTLTDYLQRGSVDVKVMIENAARNGRMRAYATKIAGDYGSPRAIEISVTRLMAGQDTVFAFAMRETGSTDKARESVGTPAEAAMLSVKELVGQATLKEIVAETTNVVDIGLVGGAKLANDVFERCNFKNDLKLTCVLEHQRCRDGVIRLNRLTRYPALAFAVALASLTTARSTVRSAI